MGGVCDCFGGLQRLAAGMFEHALLLPHAARCQHHPANGSSDSKTRSGIPSSRQCPTRAWRDSAYGGRMEGRGGKADRRRCRARKRSDQARLAPPPARCTTRTPRRSAPPAILAGAALSCRTAGRQGCATGRRPLPGSWCNSGQAEDDHSCTSTAKRIVVAGVVTEGRVGLAKPDSEAAPMLP